MELLQIKQLKKVFLNKFTLGPVSLGVKPGHTVAILGHNGAGKSTLFEIITGQLESTSGEVALLNKTMTVHSSELKKNVGYLPQNLFFPDWVCGYDLMLYAAKLLELEDKKEKIIQQMKYWDCDSYQYAPFSSLSHGMKKRIGLAISQLGNPALLILDEPFSGLDLFHTESLSNLIKERKKENKATIISTHILPYVVELCDEIYIAKNGQLKPIKWAKESQFSEQLAYLKEQFFSKQ